MPIGYCWKEDKKVPMINVVAHELVVREMPTIRVENKFVMREAEKYMLRGTCPSGHKVDVFVNKAIYSKYA